MNTFLRSSSTQPVYQLTQLNVGSTTNIIPMAHQSVNGDVLGSSGRPEEGIPYLHLDLNFGRVRIITG
jgi:hypothetical protein